MKKFHLLLIVAILFTSVNSVFAQANQPTTDNPSAREKYSAEITKDPALGYVPYNRLLQAIEYTEQLKRNQTQRSTASLNWIERGPVYDSVGPSNGNTRGGANTIGGHTSGRMRGFLLDLLNDPSGNTAFASGVAGGIWKTTTFLSGGVAPNWVAINDQFTNLAISSIAQDPTNPQIIYFATGEPTSNADAVFGAGIWKSVDGGTSFNRLPSTSSFVRSFKIGCDAAGNVYLACRTTSVPVSQSNGLYRSSNGGTSWTNITPNNLTSNNSCTDFEFTASGRLNAMFGYLGTAVNHRYTNDPATVGVGSWSTSTGFRPTNTAARRTEMAVVGELLYAVTVNSGSLADSCYLSSDGGANWTKQNEIIMPSGLATQGWYNLSLAINPNNTSEIVVGGLDAYKSIDAGATWTRLTRWVSSAPYVHADHHIAQYWIAGGETRLILGTDGGLFYSTNNGATFISKNRNLGIKQFYSAAIHPDAGSPYLLAGAQDNGVHQLKNPGLSYSIEVTGGDGALVHINQQNPLIQFGSYVFNTYRRSTNGGATWSSLNLSTTLGQFINPFDYDDAQNIMYCSNTSGTIRRWDNANTASATSSIVFNVTGMTGSLLSAKYSPFTANRLFFGTNNGKLFRLDNANAPTNGTSVSATDITGAGFPNGTIICVNTGTDDNNLVATYSNYGVNNVWVSSNAGTSWSAIDGNLPDMPVRWAMFEPGSNAKLYLATEAGVYTTTNINGSSTQWLPETTFPSVSTYMLKIRASDSTIVAATHGRGLWTSKIPAVAPVNPTVVINQAATQVDPTSVSPINFTVVFSEPVTGFTAAGVTLFGTAGATNKVVTGSGSTYNVAVSGMTNNGTVIATVSANAATGTVILNGNTPSTSTDNTVTYNVAIVPPTVTINQAATQVDPTSTSPINFTVIFNEPVTGFSAAGINISGTAGATTKVLTGTGTTYNLAVSGMTNTGTVIATVSANAATGTVNATGNTASTSTDNTVTYNNPGGSTSSVLSITGASTICNGSQTSLAVSITGGISPYTVVYSNGTLNFTVNNYISGTNISISPAATTTYSIISVTDANMNVGNGNSGIRTVTVNPTPNAVATPATQNICTGATIVPIAISGAVTGTTYSWTRDNASAISGIAASGAGATITGTLTNNSNSAATTTFTITPTANGCPGPTISATVRVNPVPTVTLNTSIAPDLIPTQVLTISATAVPTSGTYLWQKNGVAIAGVTGATLTNLTVSDVGTYRVVYTDPNGCVATSSTVEVTAKASDNLYVYPVPNNGIFNVRFYNALNEKVSLRIIDMKGATVYKTTSTTGLPYSNIRIDLTTNGVVANGSYIVEVRRGTGEVVGTKKIVIQR